MKHFTLKGEIRQKGNKAVLKAFRAQGLVPCNLYGEGIKGDVIWLCDEGRRTAAVVRVLE